MSNKYIQILENTAMKLQVLYMKKKRTTEIITKHRIQFHPHNQRKVILLKFTKIIKRDNIPLDKKFYAT